MTDRVQHHLFIGGMQRSGTTLLGRMIGQHPDASGLAGTPTREDEGQFVQDVYLDDHRMGGAHRWAHHPDAHMTESHLLTTPDARQRLDSAWEPYVEKPGAAVIVEKSPSNVMRTRWLQALYPEASFVIITRHPLIQALAIQKWSGVAGSAGWGLDRRVEHWLVAMETFHEDQVHLERALVVRYEDLVSDPASLLDSITGFAGLSPFDFDVDGIQERSARYVRYARLFVDPQSSGHPPRIIGGYRQPGSLAIRSAAARAYWRASARRERDRIKSELAPRIRRWGYEWDEFT